ncbi:hypothetical protein FJZ23_03030 [Candidatus Parcubacteria bacterium]|nr:hypothetical protein [Candidatus Parcubacteria bacterium]
MTSIASSYSSNRFTIARWFDTNIRWLNIASLALLFVLVAIYIVQVNRSVSTGYQIRELESQIHELTLLNQKLEITTQQAQSLETVTRATAMLGLVRADRPEYLQTAGPSYALAE